MAPPKRADRHAHAAFRAPDWRRSGLLGRSGRVSAGPIALRRHQLRLRTLSGTACRGSPLPDRMRHGHTVVMPSDDEARAAAAARGRARLPPRWFVETFWHGHRALLRVSGGRFGLWRPKPGRYGTAQLTTTGRRSGSPRRVVIGYFEDGPDLVTMAMKGVGSGRTGVVVEPAGSTRGRGPDSRWDLAGSCASRTGRRARAAVESLSPVGQGSR